MVELVKKKNAVEIYFRVILFFQAILLKLTWCK